MDRALAARFPRSAGTWRQIEAAPKYQYRVFYVVVDDAVVVRNIRSTRELRPWERP